MRHKRPPGRPPADGYPSHDCDETGCTVIECREHKCKPYSASGIRQVHAIISGALGAGVRWGWITYNPAPVVRLPAKRRPQPKPPTSADMARFIETAFEEDFEWGTYLWLAAVTGARRGELVALQWEDIDLDASVIVLDANYVRGPDGMILKGYQDAPGPSGVPGPGYGHAASPAQNEAACDLELLGVSLSGKTWVFSVKPDLSAFGERSISGDER